MKIEMSAMDLFYISYDEPNCEQHWANLLNIAPWAKRVHGVKGFDAAHKECARQSETDRFITVDGDNNIDPSFLNLELNLEPKFDGCVLSWASKNIINGLIYGNGGLKLWPKAETLIMNTHENSTTGRFNVDFCWDDKYIQMNNVYSTTYPNGSAFQAFRSGFREGVKMSLKDGEKAEKTNMQHHIHWKNLKRVLIWASVGSDVEYGDWAIYGARLGLWKANIDIAWDINVIRDYDWLRTYWDNEISKTVDMLEQSKSLGRELRKSIGLDIADLDAMQSKFFKSVYESPKRSVSPLVTEIEADK
jgi:hypothetical protein